MTLLLIDFSNFVGADGMYHLPLAALFLSEAVYKLIRKLPYKIPAEACMWPDDEGMMHAVFCTEHV